MNTEAPDYRPELPEMPVRIAMLPVDRGYPVPWFVAWLDEDGNPVPAGTGKPDFRVLAPGVIVRAHNNSLCWICGGKLGRYRAFVLGPMCAVNRNSAEPPSHAWCADWAARACPFLTRPDMQRREARLPDGADEPAGIMLRRNPGVALVWVTRRYHAYVVPPVAELSDSNPGVLFDIGEPERVSFYAHGRPATRAEVLASVESGLPALREYAEKQGEDAVALLERQTELALTLLPAA